MNIQDVTALVTGANRGLGRAIAQSLVEAGARKVYAAARDPKTIDLPGVEAIALDVTNPAQIAEAARTLTDVTLLVNNAGIALGTPLLADGAEAAARRELEVNYFGPLRLVQAFAPSLKGGTVVNVLSVLSWLNIPTAATYSTTKAAAWSLTNGLRGELAGQGTRLVAVHVGYMDTDMASHVDGPKADPADVARQIVEAVRDDRDEVLADELSRNVKQGLSGGVYLAAR